MDVMFRVDLHRPEWGTGGKPAVNHRLGLSTLASRRGPGRHILRTSEGRSPVGKILSNKSNGPVANPRPS
jgi:hypothetical protein